MKIKILNPNELYDKIILLGEGGFGDVYLVKYKPKNILYAMKQICISTALFEENLKSFNTEVKIISSCGHPNIISYIDSFKYEDNVYIIMPYIDSDILIVELFKLKLVYDDNKMYDLLKDIMIDLYQTLLFLRNNGIVHNDIKPNNILLITDYRSHKSILIDFGMACIDDEIKYQYGNCPFDDPYISANNKVPITHESDLYSLGATFKYILKHLNLDFSNTNLHKCIQALLFHDPNISAIEGKKMRETLSYEARSKL